MDISHAATAIMVFLTGLVPASCHKAPPPPAPKPVPAATIATNTAFTGKIGDLILTNHSETFLVFPQGDHCTFTPKVVDANTLQVTIRMENLNEYGEITNVTVAQVHALQGKPVETHIGGLNLSFTPFLAKTVKD